MRLKKELGTSHSEEGRMVDRGWIAMCAAAVVGQAGAVDGPNTSHVRALLLSLRF